MDFFRLISFGGGLTFYSIKFVCSAVLCSNSGTVIIYVNSLSLVSSVVGMMYCALQGPWFVILFIALSIASLGNQNLKAAYTTDTEVSGNGKRLHCREFNDFSHFKNVSVVIFCNGT